LAREANKEQAQLNEVTDGVIGRMRTTWDLNLFLLEPHVQAFKDALAETTDLKKRAVKDGLGFDGELYFKVGPLHEPTWSAFVGPNLKTKVDFPESQSISAVLFVRTGAASYAYAFGIGGRSLLDREAYVPDFGKKVVLSIVNPKELRSIDVRAMRDQPFLTRQQATRATGLRAFGVDTLQDHLRAVTGIPLAAHAGLANRVAGADSLAFRAKIKFDALGTRADAFKAAFDAGAYKNVEDFKWIDQVTFVRDKATIDTLDALMIAQIKQQAFGFGPPEIIDWHLNPTFAFDEDTPDDERLEFLSPAALVDAIGAANLQNVSVDILKGVSVYCFFHHGADWKEKWHAYDCIEVDLVHNEKQYAFGGGRWSVVQVAFLETVDNYVNAMKQESPPLPDAVGQQDVGPKGNLDEGAYILRVTQANANYAKIHGHQPKIYVDGDEVELCDIYDVAKDFIHLKIWRSSQGFSALAMQGANSAELLLGNRKFEADSRLCLTGKGNQFAGALPAGFNPRDYRIVLGLIRREAGEIPFFSRLTLMRAAERIIGRGLRAAFTVIAVQ
jgi:uncharacterized protein (TIGR04141 family)